MSHRVEAEKLREFCISALKRAGLDQQDAVTVADVLVMTDTWGTYSHGTGALRNYIRTLRAGGIDPHAKAEVISEGDSWALIDAHAGMGMPSCCLAVKMAIEKARVQTISWAGVRNSSHFGAAGFYANMAAEQNMFGIAMSNADPNMVVPGARGHVVGNNPLAYAIPAGKERPILLDIALSAVAAGKIFAAKALSQTIPSTWLTDAEGMPVTEVGDWPASGSMLPMAGHKGYGLALLIEGLASLLTGAGMLDELQSWVLTPSRQANLGQAFIVMNIDAIIPIQHFKDRADKMIRQLRSAPRAKDANRICVPGELEWEKREHALQHGIPLPELVLASLRETGRDLDLDISIFGS
jgi:ureidoglycolate dehydrogenase (NAD+)